MRRCAIPVALVLGAVVADGQHAHSVALYLVLAAIPAVAVAGLMYFGDLVQGSADPEAGALYVGLTALALILVVLGAAVHANTLPGDAVPALGASALVGALALLGLQLAVWTTLRLSRDRLVNAPRGATSDL